MVLTDYQLSLNNMDTGRIETALIKEEKFGTQCILKFG